MHKWKIIIVLKSGKEIVACYQGDEDNSTQVAEKIFVCQKDDIIGFGNGIGTENIFILRSEIASMTVAIY